MSTTVTYTASLRTRRTDYSVNSKNSQACQEFYNNSYNYVGIVHFPGMNLANKIITGIVLDINSDKAGYGASNTKTVYLCRSNYQEASKDDVTGADYVGTALGTFDGSFYDNLTSYSMTGELFTAMAGYIASGNNTFTLYNPNPVQSSQGYSLNYFMWSDVTVTVSYEEAVSEPTTSVSTVEMGTAFTIYTNRQNAGVTHTLTYSFGTETGTIATAVGDSATWTPPISFAYEIPNTTSGICTITCASYYGGTLTGTRTCSITVTLPDWVAPYISSVIITDTTVVQDQIGAYVKSLSRPLVSVTATGRYMSAITSYRITLDGVTYTSASFTASKFLSTAGNLTVTIVVTDSRGRASTENRVITVLDYSPPSIRLFAADRCNQAGTEAQRDSSYVRYSFRGVVTSLDNQNASAYTIFYKLTTASAWTQAETSSGAVPYDITIQNHVLAQSFSPLYSYDIKVRLSDSFGYVEQAVSIGTKQVIMDILPNGQGIAFGKIAETNGYIDCGWPLKLSSPLSVAQGGTGAANAENALINLGAVKKSGDTMTGNLNILSSMYPAVFLVPTYNDTTNRIVFEGSYAGAASFAAWEDTSGNNRRMLEVRTKGYEQSLDNAVLLRVADAGVWSAFRMFHSGMATPVPIANGGTGAASAADARANLGADSASNLTSGTLPAARLPFKIAYGTTSVNSNTSAYIDYSSAGFTSVPIVLINYATASANTTGAAGAIKVHTKTTAGCYATVVGSYSNFRDADWLAIGI